MNLTSLEQLHQLHQSLTPTSSPPHSLVISIHLNGQRISASPLLDLLLDLLSHRHILISSLELINCKLAPQFLSQLIPMIQPYLCTSFRLNLTGSCRKQEEIDTLVQLNSPFLIGIHLSTSARVTITKLLSSYQQSNSLLSLSLDKISLAATQDMELISQLLVSEDCNLRELSLQSCDLSRNENNYQILMSSLAHNRSLVSLDISGNRIRDPMSACCLYLLRNCTLKKLIYEATHLSPQVSLRSFSHSRPLAIILSGIGAEVFLGTPSVVQRMFHSR